MTEVYWFTHGHEDRNDWLRFGLMRLHAARTIQFEQRPLGDASRGFGFDPAVSAHTHRHTSVLAIRTGTRLVRVLIDSEDSFFWMSPLIAHVDVYFCAGYNRDFFSDRRFAPPYSWQTEREVAFYRERAENLLSENGQYFDRVRPFAPIGPNLFLQRSSPWLIQKAKNVYFRTSRVARQRNPWLFTYLDFQTRFNNLLALRDAPAAYDIVLQDTLWGWPRHRLKLHHQLRDLAASGYDVHSKLRWQDPMDLDGGTTTPLDKAAFPIGTGNIGDYEKMLAASRLGVFATGFHYGWRNIVTLAMMLGLPMYCDPFLIEHRHRHEGYSFFFNATGDWERLRELVEMFRDDALLAETKKKNQVYFDQHLVPEQVARDMIEDALLTAAPRTARAAPQPV